ncbi:hypothetical protein R69749_05282 [Paraburkholderia domus]|uniref:Transposase n=1 Tax=Paraburkholderia nemoris TaxID=2793076 RepID=A0ABM8SP72_9BURK|nr:hypothetical protein R69776_06278 [Paraburkholderia nemoris]CAE6836427.1 hypothetical protein R75777_06856 [Paraburkholderia nemoris]CAE6858167.1 hypothetical protein R69749_05282 [Paraburkholderia domus]
MRHLAARVARVIRIDEAWLAVEPLDMRAGFDTALARVITVFGAARPHHAYLFANRCWRSQLMLAVFTGALASSVTPLA